MIDIEIIKFYNSVKDPLWPDIHSYRDYQLLPAYIKDECNNLHNFQSRKEEICDADYWIKQTLNVCVYKDLAFVPITKCAYTYHTSLFNSMGWKMVRLCDVDVENTKFFGVIMHPIARRLKGIAQWLVTSYNETVPRWSPTNPWVFNDDDINVNWTQLHNDINTKYFKKLLGNIGLGDNHSLPYSTLFGNLLDKVHWIPMDLFTKTQVHDSLMSFFKLHGHDIQLSADRKPLNVSTDNQLQVYNTVKEIFNNNPQEHYQLYQIYSTDLKFYYNLVDKFTPDWQHI
jgi:hypothetical protein